jgi:hypothetical protein
LSFDQEFHYTSWEISKSNADADAAGLGQVLSEFLYQVDRLLAKPALTEVLFARSPL